MSKEEILDRIKNFVIDNTFWVNNDGRWDFECIDVDLLHDELDSIRKELKDKDE
jgi:ribosomal protein L15E